MGVALGSIMATIMIAHIMNIKTKSAEAHEVTRGESIALPMVSIPGAIEMR